jgi:hypothetical protein
MKERAISPSAYCAVMGVASASSTRRESAMFVGSLILGGSPNFYIRECVRRNPASTGLTTCALTKKKSLVFNPAFAGLKRMSELQWRIRVALTGLVIMVMLIK